MTGDLPLDCGVRPDTLREVRHRVRAGARRAGLADPALYHFVMAVNELLTNALRHGGGSGRVHLWTVDGVLCCAVTDAGAGMAPERAVPASRPPVGTVGGWGLWLARQVCHGMQVRTGPDGSRVVLTYRLDADARSAAVPG